MPFETSGWISHVRHLVTSRSLEGSSSSSRWVGTSLASEVAGLKGNGKGFCLDALVVGCRTSPLGLAEGDGNSWGIVKRITSGAFGLYGSYCSVSLKPLVPEINSDWAACLNACSSIGGSCLSLFPARRRIPAHAFGLKKNRGGNVPTSKTCDNEDSTTALGNSEVLSVQDPVGPPIPELFQRPEEGTKVPSSVR
jgi:hypothetical protein